MNNKLYIRIIEIINITLRLLIALGILSLCFLMITGNMGYAQTIWFLIPVPFASHLIAKYAHRIWLYITLHLFMIITYGLIFHSSVPVFVYSSYMIVLAAMNLSRRMHHRGALTYTSLVFLIFDVACYLYYDYIHMPEWRSVFLYLSLLYIALYFINLYLNNFRDIIVKYGDMAHLPIRQIEFNNHFLFAIFGMVSMIFIFLLHFLPLGNILSVIKSVLLAILKFILSLLHFSNQPPPKPSAPSNNTSSPPFVPERSLFWDILSTVFYYAIIIALLAAFIAGIIYVLIAIYKRFYSNRPSVTYDRVEFLSPFWRKESVQTKSPKPSNRFYIPFFGRSNNEKIRRHYYQAIINRLDINQLPKGITPSELSRYLLDQNKEANVSSLEQELTSLYEKARYSQKECTKEELRRMRAYMKQQNIRLPK